MRSGVAAVRAVPLARGGGQRDGAGARAAAGGAPLRAPPRAAARATVTATYFIIFFTYHQRYGNRHLFYFLFFFFLHISYLSIVSITLWANKFVLTRLKFMMLKYLNYKYYMICGFIYNKKNVPKFKKSYFWNKKERFWISAFFMINTRY